MPIYTDTLPQSQTEPKSVTLRALVEILPEVLEQPFDVWIAGKLARFGITTDNLIFLLDFADEPPPEIRSYFSHLVESLGITATASNGWKNQSIVALKLYNEGRLIIDKSTGTYRELPRARQLPILTIPEIVDKFPIEIPWQHTMYLTGGIVKNGWSANDVDIIIEEPGVQKKTLGEIRNYFTQLLGGRTDVGRRVMPEREPVYLYKLYEAGRLCLPQR